MLCNFILTQDCECVAFHAKKLVSLAIKTYELDDIDKDQLLTFAAISDGTKIANNLHAVVAGFKAVDAGAIDPITQRLIKPQTHNVF